MGIMDYISAIEMGIILLVIWFQQKKINLLKEKIDSQSSLIEETKSVVTQQATAIDSQNKIVKTAIDYSTGFDPKKLEDIIKREMLLENKENLVQIKKEHNIELSKVIDGHNKEKNEIITTAIDVTSKVLTDTFITGLVHIVIKCLFRFNKDEREKIIMSIEKPQLKNLIQNIMDDIEKITKTKST